METDETRDAWLLALAGGVSGVGRKLSASAEARSTAVVIAG